MAQLSQPVRLCIADELGQLKLLQAPALDRLDSLSIVAKWGQPDKARAVQSLAVGSQGGLFDTATATAAVGRKDGSIDILNPCTGEIRWQVPATSAADPSTSIEAIELCFTGAAAVEHSAAPPPLVASCTAGGAARLLAAEPADPSGWKELASWKVPATVTCSAFDPGSGLLAVGSQGAEMRLYDLSSPDQPVFTARGGRPNRVGLCDLPWNSALSFFPGSDGAKIWVGTGKHKLRLYDTKAGKRPQLEVAFANARITALAPTPDGRRCWVADGSGKVEAYDVAAGKFMGAVKGIAGSVRSLALHPDGRALASAGLDRFLRVHDEGRRTGMGKVYVKTQITGVAWCPADAAAAAAANAAEAAQGEEKGEQEGRQRAEEASDEEKEQGEERMGGGSGSGRGRKHRRGGGSAAEGNMLKDKKKLRKKG